MGVRARFRSKTLKVDEVRMRKRLVDLKESVDNGKVENFGLGMARITERPKGYQTAML